MYKIKAISVKNYNEQEGKWISMEPETPLPPELFTHFVGNGWNVYENGDEIPQIDYKHEFNSINNTDK